MASRSRNQVASIRQTGGARVRRRRGWQRWNDGREARRADRAPPGGRCIPREARRRTALARSRNGHRALRDHSRTGARRLRGRVRGQGSGPRPPGGGEGRSPGSRHGGGRQGLPGGRGDCSPGPSEPDHPPRGGEERARAVPGVRVASREDAGSPDRGRSAPGTGGGSHRDRGCSRSRACPRRGSDPPGSQARERVRHEQGAGEDPRLRDGPRLRASSTLRRHAGLHGAGAVGGRSGGRAHRRLRAGRDALPDALGRVPVPGREGEVVGGAGDSPEARRARRPRTRRTGREDARPDTQGTTARRHGGAGGAHAHRGAGSGGGRRMERRRSMQRGGRRPSATCSRSSSDATSSA